MKTKSGGTFLLAISAFFTLLTYLVFYYIFSYEAHLLFYIFDFIITFFFMASVLKVDLNNQDIRSSLYFDLFVVALIIFTLAFLYFLVAFLIQSVYESAFFIVNSIQKNGLQEFIKEDASNSFFPLRIASFILTYSIGYNLYKFYKKRKIISSDRKLKILSFSIFFQYFYYLLSLITLWRINDFDLSVVADQQFLLWVVVALSSVLIWAFSFIVDDYGIISTYALQLKIKPIKEHQKRIFFFNAILLIGMTIFFYISENDIKLIIMFYLVAIAMLILAYEIWITDENKGLNRKQRRIIKAKKRSKKRR